jgi:hypothetical protein
MIIIVSLGPTQKKVSTYGTSCHANNWQLTFKISHSYRKENPREEGKHQAEGIQDYL